MLDLVLCVAWGYLPIRCEGLKRAFPQTHVCCWPLSFLIKFVVVFSSTCSGRWSLWSQVTQEPFGTCRRFITESQRCLYLSDYHLERHLAVNQTSA